MVDMRASSYKKKSASRVSAGTSKKSVHSSYIKARSSGGSKSKPTPSTNPAINANRAEFEKAGVTAPSGVNPNKLENVSTDWEKIENSKTNDYKKTEIKGGVKSTRVIRNIEEGMRPASSVGVHPERQPEPATRATLTPYEIQFNNKSPVVMNLSEAYKKKLEEAIAEENKARAESQFVPQKPKTEYYYKENKKVSKMPSVFENTPIANVGKAINLLYPVSKKANELGQTYDKYTNIDRNEGLSGIDKPINFIGSTSKEIVRKTKDTLIFLAKDVPVYASNFYSNQFSKENLAKDPLVRISEMKATGKENVIIAGSGISAGLMTFGTTAKTNPVKAISQVSSEIGTFYALGEVGRLGVLADARLSAPAREINFNTKLANIDSTNKGFNYISKENTIGSNAPQKTLGGTNIEDSNVRRLTQQVEQPIKQEDILGLGITRERIADDAILAFDVERKSTIYINKENIKFITDPANKGRFTGFRTEPANIEGINIKSNLANRENIAIDPDLFMTTPTKQAGLTEFSKGQAYVSNDFRARTLKEKVGDAIPKIKVTFQDFGKKGGQVSASPEFKPIDISITKSRNSNYKPSMYEEPSFSVSKETKPSSKGILGIGNKGAINSNSDISLLPPQKQSPLTPFDSVSIKPLQRPLRDIRRDSGASGTILLEKAREKYDRPIIPMFRSNTRTKSFLDISDITKTSQKNRQDTKLIISPIQRPISDTRLDSELKTDLRNEPIQDIIFKPIKPPTPRPPRERLLFDESITKPKIERPPRVLKFGLGSRTQIANKPRKAEIGYNLFVKEFGEFKGVNERTLTFKEAKNLGMSITGSTASASFRLEKTNKLIIPRSKRALKSSGNTFSESQFYRNKSGTYIEKSKFRIDTAGEKSEITKKGLLSFGSTKKKKNKGGKNALKRIKFI